MITQKLDQINPGAPGHGWTTHIWEDEVIHDNDSLELNLCVAEFPFIDGCFVSRVGTPDNTVRVTTVLVGPFESLNDAVAFLRLTSKL